MTTFYYHEYNDHFILLKLFFVRMFPAYQYLLFHHRFLVCLYSTSIKKTCKLYECLLVIMCCKVKARWIPQLVCLRWFYLLIIFLILSFPYCMRHNYLDLPQASINGLFVWLSSCNHRLEVIGNEKINGKFVLFHI